MKICGFYCKANSTVEHDYNKIRMRKILIKVGVTVSVIALTHGVLAPTFAYAAGASGSFGTAGAIGQANKLAAALWSILLAAARVVFLVYGGKQVITDVLNGDIKDAVRTFLKYMLGFWLLILFPKALDWVTTF